MAETPEPAAVQEEAPLAMAEEASLEPPLPLPLAAGGIRERHFRFNTPTEESLAPTRYQRIIAGGFDASFEASFRAGASSSAPGPFPKFEQFNVITELNNYDITVELIEMQRLANMRIFEDAVEYTILWFEDARKRGKTEFGEEVGPHIRAIKAMITILEFPPSTAQKIEHLVHRYFSEAEAETREAWRNHLLQPRPGYPY